MPANNYGPTTPAPAKTKAAAARARAGGGTSKPVAGPSTKPSSNAIASKKAVSKPTNAIVLDGDESDEVMVVEDAQTKKRRKGSEDEEVVAMPGPAKGASRKGPVRGASGATGTSKAAAAKGKARADSLDRVPVDIQEALILEDLLFVLMVRLEFSTS